MLLIAAGLGDMLGKITSLADWRLSHILNDEPMPEDIVRIIESALEKIIEGAPHVTKRDPAAIQSITEGLILSGIAMSLHGDSRPASCTEHHLSHFWEMLMYAQGKKPALHGIKVGLATIIVLAMWKELLFIESPSSLVSTSINTGGSNGTVPPLGSDITSNLSPSEPYEQNIRRLYGVTADEILKTKNPGLPIEHIINHWQEILEIAKSLPAPEYVAKMLSAAGAPTRPVEIGLDSDSLRDSIIYARDRKKTYSILQLLGNLGRLEDFSNRVEKYFSETALSGVKCFVMDMDGTIYLGDRLFPFTKSFLERLRETGRDYVFFTNNSSRNAGHYLKKLQSMGISIPPEKFLMSTQVLLTHLKSCHENRPPDNPGNPDSFRVFVAGTDAMREDFSAAGYILTDEKPDFAVLGFDTDMDYGRLTRLCDLVRSGLPYYGVNIDLNCPIEGGFIPDCGALASAVAASTGITPEFFGKPSRHALDYIIQKTGYSEDELCFIGDRLYTDIAITASTRSHSVLVLSGETKREDLHGSEFIPELVVDDLSELMGYL
jgi:glycerol-1-phosphate dehydrogenase [NAD(P)+]